MTVASQAVLEWLPWSCQGNLNIALLVIHTVMSLFFLFVVWINDMLINPLRDQTVVQILV